MIEIYTDGSYRKSELMGGYGLIAFQNDKIIYAKQEQIKNTTNNQMELMAIIKACEWADSAFPQEEIIIYSDSAYCVNSINDWMYNWKRNGWINSKNEEVKNIDLMKTLYKYFSKDFYHCQVLKTSGHCGIAANELADALATNDKTKFIKIIQDNNISIENL